MRTEFIPNVSSSFLPGISMCYTKIQAGDSRMETTRFGVQGLRLEYSTQTLQHS